MKIPVFDSNGKRTKEILEFDEEIFGEKVNKKLLKESILMYEARQRQGTHATKTRGMRAGTRKKQWRQKGTGRARIGNAKSPHRLGGGVAFGPHPRDYSYSITKKAKQIAMNSAWLSKFQDKEVMVIDKFNIEETPKTSVVFKTLQIMDVGNKKVLIGIDGYDEKLQKSVRNISKVSIENISCFNPYILLYNEKILLSKESFIKLITDKNGKVKNLNREDLYK